MALADDNFNLVDGSLNLLLRHDQAAYYLPTSQRQSQRFPVAAFCILSAARHVLELS